MSSIVYIIHILGIIASCEGKKFIFYWCFFFGIILSLNVCLSVFLSFFFFAISVCFVAMVNMKLVMLANSSSGSCDKETCFPLTLDYLTSFYMHFTCIFVSPEEHLKSSSSCSCFSLMLFQMP